MNVGRTIEFLLSHGASTDARLDKVAQRRTDRRFDHLINILAKSGGIGRRR